MIWALLGLLAAVGAVAPSVHRRQVRLRTVRHIRASIAGWLTSDLAAPLLPVVAAPSAVAGTTPQGLGVSPDLLVPAVRRFHFELTPYEIEHHRRVS